MDQKKYHFLLRKMAVIPLMETLNNRVSVSRLKAVARFRAVARLLIGVLPILCFQSLSAQVNLRRDLALNDNWYSIASDSNQHAYEALKYLLLILPPGKK